MLVEIDKFIFRNQSHTATEMSMNIINDAMKAEERLVIMVTNMYELLKDIANASENGQPYSEIELSEMIRPLLNKAYEFGVRGKGEK